MRTCFSLLFIFIINCNTGFAQNTVLWKLTKEGSTYTSYLLGSQHLFGSSFIETYPVIKENLLSCDIVITETPINRAAIAQRYNDRNYADTLSTIISKDEFNFIDSILKKSAINIRKLTPGELYMKLLSAYPKYRCQDILKNDSLTMDEYVQFLGSRQQKHLYYLETDSFQMGILTAISKEYDWSFFKASLPAILAKYKNDRAIDNPCAPISLYASFKLSYNFKEECNFLKGGNTNDIILRDRNAAWMKKLPQLLDQQNCFITVGLFHLYNQCGIIQQLKMLGYKVEPVKLKK
ncbi:TraB/GumN family protein [Ferruginibacter sp. SUN106]|uniref:TraB/GumN family protein n=1 Tax=Ferruginibacter sp. SUN106 TaxID=2978348 RepID=UPI003D35F548